MKNRLPLTSLILALLQFFAGIAMIAYGIKLMHDWGAFRTNVGFAYTTAKVRDRYTLQFLYYAGIGLLQMFAGACILGRQTEAPLMAQVVGVLTMAIISREIVLAPSISLPGWFLLLLVLFYTIWFYVRRKDF